MINALIICARNQEVTQIADIVREASQNVRKKSIRGVRNGVALQAYTINGAGGKNVTVAIVNCGEMGNVHAAARTSAFVLQYCPTFVVFCGVAGSLDPKKVRLADVIVPTSVYNYTLNKVWDVSDAERLELVNKSREACFEMMADRSVMFRDVRPSIKIDNQSLQLLTELSFDQVSQDLESDALPADFENNEDLWTDRPAMLVREEELFSWEMVFDSDQYREHLRAKNALNGAVAVDMESYGFLVAIREQREISDYPLGGMVVRGISDYVGQKAACDRYQREHFRSMALRNAALVAIRLIQLVDIDDFLQERVGST